MDGLDTNKNGRVSLEEEEGLVLDAGADGQDHVAVDEESRVQEKVEQQHDLRSGGGRL